MAKQYLDFAKISQSVSFMHFLDFLNIAYTRRNGVLKGQTDKFSFVVNVNKNLFKATDDDSVKGSIINFLSALKGMELRESALWIQKKLIDIPSDDTKSIPDLKLEYHSLFEELSILKEVTEEYGAGYCKSKSIMQGRIAFRVSNPDGSLEGYVGWHTQKGNWLFPKNFVRPLYNLNNVSYEDTLLVTVDPFDCLRLISLGFKNTVSLLAKSMTREQEAELLKFKTIILLHPEPENILNRLSKKVLVRAPSIRSRIVQHSAKEIEAFVS